MINTEGISTIRQCITEVRTNYLSMDAVVFTTFSFSPEIFEQNILPIVCGTADFNDEKERQHKTNIELSTIPVSVFYDPSGCSIGGTAFRYSTFAVNHRNAQGDRTFFHPKCVLISGKLVDSGKDAISLICGSANLTKNGIGKNCECFGVTVVSSSSNPAFEAIGAFLAYLQNIATTGLAKPQKAGLLKTSAISILRQKWEVLKRINDYEDGPRFYFSQNEKGGFIDFFMAGRKNGWESIIIASPYWSNIFKELNALSEINTWHFVPTRMLGQIARYGIAKSEFDEMKNIPGIHYWEPKEDFCGGIERFWHAKVYVLLNKIGDSEELRIAVGSANCTTNGLSGVHGNIEAMLVDTLNGQKIFKKLQKEYSLKVSPADEALFLERSDEEDCEEPQVPPLDLVILFDWATRLYRIHFIEEQVKELPLCNICLSGIDKNIDLHNIKSVAQFTVPTENLKQINRTFKLEYRRNNENKIEYFFGIITELNDEYCDTKEYEPTCDIQEIMDRWKKVKNGTGMLKPGNGDGGNSTRITIVNMFDFYRASKDLKERLKSHLNLNQLYMLRSLLIRPPSGVYSMALQIIDSDVNIAEKLTILWECENILRTFLDVEGLEIEKAHDEVKKKIRKIRSTVVAALAKRRDICGNMGDDLAKVTKSFEILEWFRDNINTIG